jgi:hypothetical protein
MAGLLLQVIAVVLALVEVDLQGVEDDLKQIVVRIFLLKVLVVAGV